MDDAREIYREAFQHFVDDRIDEAIEGYRRAIEADPNLALAWNGLSMAYRHKGDLDAAIEAGHKLVDLEPDDPLSHTNLSILYQSKGMIPEAEEAMARATQLQSPPPR
jgi:tetratricopeptide (TPR) repeat protein